MTFTKVYLTLLLSIASILTPCYGNMAAPWIEGTPASEMYASKHLDIIKEELNVNIIDHSEAEFDVKYFIKSDSTHKEMLFIFDIMGTSYDRKDNNFKVYIDNKEIEILNADLYYSDSIQHKWQSELNSSHPFLNNFPNQFYYFRIDIPKGEHIIHITYTAIATINLGSIVKSYTFYYNLHPAKHWKSFGKLYLNINANNIKEEIITDLPVNKNLSWKFNKIPQDSFSITIKPQISKSAYFFISVSHLLPIAILAILIIIHISAILRYRKNNINKIISPPLLIGIVLIPIVFCVVFILSFDLIDWILGDNASKRHGYIYLIFFGVPIYMIVYTVILLAIDIIAKFLYRKKDIE